MSSSIFNENIQNRVINPRSGSSMFVDLSSNQIIGGIKRFLNNLITNSDVNFNTTANVGRIIFYPNEPAGSGSQIVSIYTEDENDGHGWFFDSVGNLYYLGGGLSPVKIMLAGATGDLTILSNFNGFGDIICHNILTSDIISSYSGGNITFNNGIALGSNTINSGNITSTGTISGVDISSTGIIFANDVNLTSTGYLNVNNITSSVASGSYQTKISLSNEFIDTNSSSLDIVATYIGFASPIQTLSTASKYMFIKPLSTGDFEMLMNNIANKILISDWATTKISSQFIWNLNNISNQNAIILDSLTTSGNRLQIYGTAAGTKYLYYNISNELGVIDGATSQWKITGIGEATFSSLSVGSGPISTSGNISCGAITATSLTTSGGRKKSTTMYQISVTLGLNNHVVVLYGNSMNITCTLPSSPINGQEYYITCQDSFYTVTLSSITSPILSPFGTLYYSASMVKGSYVHLIFVSSTGYWSMISGNIAGFSTSGNITGGLITGTSISAGTGPISTTGAIGGGAITGTSLSAGTGPISTTGGNISGGAISGSSLTAGSGPISTTGNISGGLITGTSITAGSGPISTTGAIGGGAITGTSLSAGTGPISTTGGNISGGAISGSSLTAGSGPISTTGPIDGGAITGTSLTAGSGPISTTGNISGVDITSTNIIYAKSINMQPIGFLNVNNITSSATTGSYPTAIALSNEFIDTGNSSLDIIATYIGFGNPQQTLSTASKYMYIKPLSTGNFEMLISNIASKVFSTNWSTLTLTSDFNLALGSKTITTSGTIEGGDINANGALSLRNTSSLTNILLNPTTTSGNRLLIYGITSGTKFLYYNTSNNIGVYNTITGANVWSIDGTTGNFNTIGTLTTNLISASTGTNSIQMDNRFFNLSVGSIDLKSTYIGFPQLSQTLSTASKYMAIVPQSDGNFHMSINNIASRVLISNWSSLILSSEFNWRFLKSVGVNRILMFNTSTIGDIFQICRTGDNAYGDGYWYWNNSGNCGYISSGIVRWEILNTGGMNLTSDLNISNRVIVSPAVVAGEIMTVRINAGLEPRFHFSTNSNFGFWSGTAHTYYVNGPTGNITTNGSLTCGPINCSTILVTNNTNTALTLSSGGIHLQNNNWLFGRCKFGDADYAYVAEYDTGDSDKLYLFGSTGIYCNTLPVVVSDKRLKENIEDFIIDNPLEIIDKIRLVEYNRIDNPSKTRVLGYIAQEILEIFPKAVEIDQTVIKKDENSVLFKKNNDGTDSEEPEREQRLALNYSYISMLNTEAIKQLNEKVEKQQILIDSLIKRLEILELNNNLD